MIQHLNLLAGAPGGVARLRELILSLAVQGRLVPQDASDEAAELLLARVRSARSQLAVEGRIGRVRPVPPVSEDEAPFSLPKGWAWCRLADLAWPQAGFAFKSSGFNGVGDGLPLIRIRDVGSGTPPTTFFSGEYREEFLVENGDWLISMDGEFRVRRWHATKALLNQRVTRLAFYSAEVNADFVAAALQRGLTSLQGTKAYTTVDHLSGRQIAEAAIGLPPVKEQERIVSRVNELMRLCDALEAKGRLELAQHASLIEGILCGLENRGAKDSLAAGWRRVAENFDLLTNRSEAVDAVEQAVYRLAVRGLLVGQDKADEPASAFLERLRIVQEGKQTGRGSRMRKALKRSHAADKPFPLPDGWAWAVLPDLGEITGGSTPSKAIESNWSGPIPWVSPKDMKVARIDDAQDHVSDAALRGSLSLISPGSLLMIVRGMILAHSFPVAETGVPVTINQDMKAFTPFEPKLLPYLTLICMGMKREILGLVDRSTHGTCKLESSKIFSLPIPIPPLAEQERIVARAVLLRRVCNDLRKCLAAHRAVQSSLAAALVERAVA